MFLVFLEGYNNNNNNNNNYNGAISQSPPEKWNSYIAFLCTQGCKVRRPTQTSVVGKNIVFFNIWAWHRPKTSSLLKGSSTRQLGNAMLGFSTSRHQLRDVPTANRCSRLAVVHRASMIWKHFSAFKLKSLKKHSKKRVFGISRGVQQQ